MCHSYSRDGTPGGVRSTNIGGGCLRDANHSKSCSTQKISEKHPKNSEKPPKIKKNPQKSKETPQKTKKTQRTQEIPPKTIIGEKFGLPKSRGESKSCSGRGGSLFWSTVGGSVIASYNTKITMFWVSHTACTVQMSPHRQDRNWKATRGTWNCHQFVCIALFIEVPSMTRKDLRGYYWADIRHVITETLHTCWNFSFFQFSVRSNSLMRFYLCFLQFWLVISCFVSYLLYLHVRRFFTSCDFPSSQLSDLQKSVEKLRKSRKKLIYVHKNVIVHKKLSDVNKTSFIKCPSLLIYLHFYGNKKSKINIKATIYRLLNFIKQETVS